MPADERYDDESCLCHLEQSGIDKNFDIRMYEAEIRLVISGGIYMRMIASTVAIYTGEQPMSSLIANRASWTQ